MIKNSDGTYTLFNEENGTEKYTADGYILERKNEQGVGWTFAYSGKYLQSVTHSSGRAVQLAWSGGVVSQVTDPAGNVYRYTYTANVFGSGDGYARLASTILPGSPQTTVSYHYEDSRFPGGLTGKSFNGTRYSTFTYDDEGRATSTVHAGEVERYAFSYAVQSTEVVTPPPVPVPPGGFRSDESHGYCDYKPGTGRICYQPMSVGGPVLSMSTSGVVVAAATTTTKTIPQKLSVTETNPLGRKTTYVFVDDRLTNVTGDATAHCPASYKEKTYDANGYDDVVSDFADNLTDFDHDAQGHLLKKVEAVGTSAERTTTYAWDTVHNRLLKETLAGDHEVRYEYTGDGRIAKTTLADLSAAGQGRVRTTTYAYTQQSNGLVSKVVVDGPLPGNGDSMTYEYSTAGDLVSATNGLGHKTTYTGYNALGQPGRVTGPNGEVTGYSYDARGRVTQAREIVNGAARATSYAYDATGQLASVTTPDGLVHAYRYDAALRLAEEYQSRTEGGTERKRYLYNNASQVTKVEVLQTQ